MKEVMYDYFYQIEDKHWWFQSRRKVVMELIDKYYKKLNSGANVLDIGCGTGMMLKYLSRYGDIQGMDMDPKAVQYSKKKSPTTKIILGSIPERLPKEKFDLITALDILEHIKNDIDALKAIAKILKNDGLLIITVPAYRFLWSAHDKINEHKRRYQISELKRKLEKSGLKIKKISHYNTFLFLPIFFGIFLKKFFGSGKPKSHFEKVPNFIINWLLETIFSSEKYFLPFINFPFGVSIIAVTSKEN